jgi:hypothetical protein
MFSVEGTRTLKPRDCQVAQHRRRACRIVPRCRILAGQEDVQQSSGTTCDSVPPSGTGLLARKLAVSAADSADAVSEYYLSSLGAGLLPRPAGRTCYLQFFTGPAALLTSTSTRG